MTVSTGRLKSFTPTSFKAVGQTFEDQTLADGEFIALAAVFGNIDSYGERMVKGAFTETLAEWEASGNPIPVIWQHDWSDPLSHIGYVEWARETDEGLLYKGVLDIADNPKAAQIHRLMKGRRVTQQSFGFDVLDGAELVENEKYVFEIHRVKLFEVGPCLVGVNNLTETLEVKGAQTTAAPAAVTPEPAPAEPGTESTSQEQAAAADPPSEAPGSTPTKSASPAMSPASVLLLLDINTLEGTPE